MTSAKANPLIVEHDPAHLAGRSCWITKTKISGPARFVGPVLTHAEYVIDALVSKAAVVAALIMP